MSQEKFASTAALIISILALIVAAAGFMTSSGSFASAPAAAPAPGGPGGGQRGAPGGGGPGGPGGGGRGFTVTPEFTAKYQERVALLTTRLQELEKSKAAADQVAQARLALDEAKLAQARLNEGRRPNASFIDALLAVRNAIDPITRNQAELRVIETSRRIGEDEIKQAETLLKNYPATPLSPEILQNLLALEPRR